MLPLTVWMNHPSFYQGDLFRSLIASELVDLQVIFAKRLPADRLQLRWQEDLHGYPYRFLKQKQGWGDAVHLAWAQRKRLHIVNGIWAEPAFTAALTALAFARSRYVIHSEAPEPDLNRSPIKRALRSGLGRMLATRACGVLPISHWAEAFYRRLGVPEPKLYPFGYFRSKMREQAATLDAKANGTSEIVFVGQMIGRKGLDVLLTALPPLFADYPKLTLTLIGEGQQLPELRTRVKAMGLSDRICFKGSMTPEETPARISAAALLVLPSRWDGWGLVINEALSVGVPVIASDHCGAADLIRHGDNGYVFRSGNAEDLQTCLRVFLENPSDWPQLRTNAAMMGERISSEVAAVYLIQCLQHMIGRADKKPLPPWSAGMQKAQVIPQ